MTGEGQSPGPCPLRLLKPRPRAAPPLAAHQARRAPAQERPPRTHRAPWGTGPKHLRRETGSDSPPSAGTDATQILTQVYANA